MPGCFMSFYWVYKSHFWKPVNWVDALFPIFNNATNTVNLTRGWEEYKSIRILNQVLCDIRHTKCSLGLLMACIIMAISIIANTSVAVVSLSHLVQTASFVGQQTIDQKVLVLPLPLTQGNAEFIKTNQ